MTTTHADLACLLMPVSAESPAGKNVEYEKIYDDIRVARESDPAYLPQDEWSYSEPRRADWHKVIDLCYEALSTQTKDFQIACWLVEALVHTNGLEGLEKGLYFLDDFIRRYWYQCWPEFNDEGEIYRHSKLSRLENDLTEILCNLNLLDSTTLSVLAWRKSLHFDSQLKKRPEDREALLEEEGHLTIENFMRQASSHSSADISRLADRIEIIIEHINRLEAACQSVSPQEFHSFSQLRAMINEMHHLLQKIAMNVLPDSESMVELDFDTAGKASPDSEARSPALQYSITSRSLAVIQMHEVARYFRENEPSSPVPYLLDRAIRWTGMSMTDWLEEMLSDANSRREIDNVLTGKSDQ